MSEEQEIQENHRDSLLRMLYGRALRNSVIMLAFVAVIWGVLNYFVPDGWAQAVVNIGIFLFTLAIAVSIKSLLQTLGNPGWLAWMITLVIWVVAGMAVRSVTVVVLEAIV